MTVKPAASGTCDSLKVSLNVKLKVLPLASALAKDGNTVSSVKPPIVRLLRLPAVSVAVVDTDTAPSPRPAKSSALSTTAWARPSLVKVLSTVPAPLVRLTDTNAPDSATKLSTPPAALASAAVLELSPTATTARLGAIVSSVKPPLLLVLILPAASFTLVVTSTAPSASVARLALVKLMS